MFKNIKFSYTLKITLIKKELNIKTTHFFERVEIFLFLAITYFYNELKLCY